MPAQTWNCLLNWQANNFSSGSALASSTTLTDISATPQFVLPANFLQPGSTLRVTATGVFSTAGTPTLLLGVYYGAVAGTALAATGATTTASGVTNLHWRLEYTGVVRTVGSSGTIMGAGVVDLATTAALMTRIPIPAATQAAVTIDTTAAKSLTIGAQWGTNSASNTTTLNQLLIESMA